MEKGATLYGGHDCEFVEKVPDRYICQICTKVLRDPHLAVCCGQHFCESCLNKWFTRQGKESCPHCRAEGEAFHHVIHKGLRSEVNEFKIRCSNHRKGCQWTGELGVLKTHLESDNGCGYVTVKCPNNCLHSVGIGPLIRKDVHKHITQDCFLRPYRCEFCGLKDTYHAITGLSEFFVSLLDEDGYAGHQAKCPEAPLACPNNCGSEKIKRKNMKRHRSQCPQEPVEGPFAEAGCKVDIHRHQLDGHMTTSLQHHVMLLMIDRKQLKGELNEVKAKLSKAEAELNETRCELLEAKARLTTELGAGFSYSVNKLEKLGDSVILLMHSFSKYRRSGEVWQSPPFYYREGYKMCLAVHANGVGEGAGTHVSVVVLHFRGEYDDQLSWPKKCDCCMGVEEENDDGYFSFDTCTHNRLRRYPAVNEHIEIERQVKFCGLNNEKILHLVNDCLTFCVEYDTFCRIIVKIM